jgi:hypothetical protein
VITSSPTVQANETCSARGMEMDKLRFIISAESLFAASCNFANLLSPGSDDYNKYE